MTDQVIGTEDDSFGDRPSTLWFVFSGTRMVVSRQGERSVIPEELTNEGFPSLPIVRSISLGQFGGHSCIAAEIPPNTDLPSPFALLGVWSLYDLFDQDLFTLVLRAVHYINWSRDDRFCPRCAAQTSMKDDELAHQCPSCGLVTFPRISPAIIVLVERGNEILLARSPRFKKDFYSVLAGFVEPGETLEDTVKREVREETGIEVTDITYFGSQPWPFPDSLMIGFTATYAGGTVTTDAKEIITAGWFDYRTLPPVPSAISIARRLIDAFILRKGGCVR